MWVRVGGMDHPGAKFFFICKPVKPNKLSASKRKRWGRCKWRIDTPFQKREIERIKGNRRSQASSKLSRGNTTRLQGLRTRFQTLKPHALSFHSAHCPLALGDILTLLVLSGAPALWNWGSPICPDHCICGSALRVILPSFHPILSFSVQVGNVSAGINFFVHL
jgi:hypothetical protein